LLLEETAIPSEEIPGLKTKNPGMKSVILLTDNLRINEKEDRQKAKKKGPGRKSPRPFFFLPSATRGLFSRKLPPGPPQKLLFNKKFC
jgi:hypothetical protein